MKHQEAQYLAVNLMAKHGLIEKGWGFAFNTRKRAFGICSYRRRTIELSLELTELNSEERVKNTILHEIAHALTEGHGHDSVWRRKAIEIGCDGERCYSAKNTITPRATYQAVCAGCGFVHGKLRAPRATQSCGFCSNGRFNPTFKLEFIRVK